MRLAKSLFIAIDKVFKLPQNPIKLERRLNDVKCEKDIVYDEKYPEFALDVYYLPKANAKYPVILEIHGGGFTAGDKQYRDCLCKYLAKHTGAAVVNVNYGVGVEYTCPLPMQQLVSAVNWVADNAEQRGWDISKFVATGDSAGAFYACFLAVLQDSSVLQELYECSPKARITATVLNCGLYDMRSYMRKNNRLNNEVCKEFLGVPLSEAHNSKYFDSLNLLNYVGENFPTSFVIYAKKDVFCKGQGEKLLAKMQQNGVSCESIHSNLLIDNHVYSLNWIGRMARLTNKKMLEFLNNHFAEDDEQGKVPAPTTL